MFVVFHQAADRDIQVKRTKNFLRRFNLSQTTVD